MTNQIEKEFFNIFKLKPKTITPEIILKLFKIVLKIENELHFDIVENEYACTLGSISCDYYQYTFEDAFLKLCTNLAPQIKEEVKAVFR